MRSLVALALLLAAGAALQAKPAPYEPQLIAISPDNMAISTGAASATLEQDYFHAPQTPYATGRIFPCRMQLRVFDKTRLAQACH
jgi:hypothetical protein